VNWKSFLSKEYVINFEYISLTSNFTKIMDMRQIVKSCLTIAMLFFFNVINAQSNSVKDQLQVYIDNGKVQNGVVIGMKSANPQLQYAIKQESSRTPGKFRYYFIDGRVGRFENGNFIFYGKWDLDKSNGASSVPSNSNQNCNYSIQRLPINEYRYIDNRVLCIYCRSNYIPYSKVDISASLKREVLIDYMFDLIDEHCENLGADNNHKAVHIEQVMNYFLKRGDYTDRADFASEIVKHYNVFQSRNPNPMSIKLYDNNNTRFCSREHEDRYNRRY